MLVFVHSKVDDIPRKSFTYSKCIAYLIQQISFGFFSSSNTHVGCLVLFVIFLCPPTVQVGVGGPFGGSAHAPVGTVAAVGRRWVLWKLGNRKVRMKSISFGFLEQIRGWKGKTNSLFGSQRTTSLAICSQDLIQKVMIVGTQSMTALFVRKRFRNIFAI